MTKKSHINPQPNEDLIYRALANPLRRRILDIVRREPGVTLGEIAASFDVSRFAIRKHLQMLLDATLLSVEPDGTAKRHHLNPVAIQFIYDRWLSEYSGRWASALTGLKYTLEGELMNPLQHRYEVYIRASADQVWRAITDPDFTQQFYYNMRIDSSFEEGASLQYVSGKPGDGPVITGEVLEANPPTRLVHTFDFGNGDGPSRVTYDIEDLGGVSKLTLVHDEFDSETKTYQEVGPGWNPILSGMKTFLETGRALEIPQPAHTN
ncbi:MAG: SRPBCC domain-containing protein [Rhodothermales bacterium]|nr:SRPBCC domain-containing protein [Rhodothermales bacterium]MBO6778732.1 SRPBCC domain-containing protein [Rhodothermales bacterium]